LTEAELNRHTEANATFNEIFVSAPSNVNPGLGPLFNNTSCNGCHLRNGRGMPIIGSDTSLKSQLLVRVSLPYGNPEVISGAVPVAGIGTQIRDHAIYGYKPNATVDVKWKETAGKYTDGTSYKLRSPIATITLPDGEPLSHAVMTSLRIPAACD